jgi:hypothetical protein
MMENMIKKRINYKYLESSYLESLISKLAYKLETYGDIRIGNKSKPIYIRNKRIIKKEIRKIKNIIKLRNRNAK